MLLPKDITSIIKALITESPKPVKISTAADVIKHKTNDKRAFFKRFILRPEIKTDIIIIKMFK